MHSHRAIVVGIAVALSFISLPAYGQERAPRRASMISAEEIESAGAGNALELVRKLRPQWLRTRGRNTFQTRRGWDETSRQTVDIMAPPEIVVYVNGVRHGNQHSLREITAHQVASLQFLDATSAAQKFGTGHEHGAILVELRQ